MAKKEKERQWKKVTNQRVSSQEQILIKIFYVPLWQPYLFLLFILLGPWHCSLSTNSSLCSPLYGIVPSVRNLDIPSTEPLKHASPDANIKHWFYIVILPKNKNHYHHHHHHHHYHMLWCLGPRKAQLTLIFSFFSFF